MSMSVNAIDSNDKRRSCIVPMAKGAGIGAAAGFVLKYAQPLTPQELKDPEYVKVINKISREKTAYSERTEKYLGGIRNKKSLSPAEDVFIKMFDGMKEGEHVKRSVIRKSILGLKEQNPNYVKELKRLCKDSTAVAEQTAKKCIDAYNLITKHARPTAFFITTGAVAGAFIALVNDILKTDVKKS